MCMTCSLYSLHRRDVAEIPCDDVIVPIITQQVVKQTVMTVVYGVTRVGGRLQIAVSSVLHLVPAAWQPHPSHIHTFDPPSIPLPLQKQLHGTIPDKELFSCANYVVGCVFESLREMFTNARQIQVCWHTDKHANKLFFF